MRALIGGLGGALGRLVRGTAVRWALAIALWSSLMSLVLFGFVYWQTAGVMEAGLAHALRHQLDHAAADPALAEGRLRAWLDEDLHNAHFGGLFGLDGARRLGNLDAVPAGLAPDGEVRRVAATVMIAGRRLEEEMWAAVRILPDGRALVVAHDTDEIDRGAATILRALAYALGPMLVLSLAGGAVLAGRARRRVAATEAAVAALMRGDLWRRLPVGGSGDAFDRLARDVNALLDEIVRLMEEVRGVGDAVAHDLRTPLTRLRARLERSRGQARTADELRAAIDQGLAWIDQTLAMVTAVLRIGEIEGGRRRGGFAPVDLAVVVTEAVEFFEPAAEEKGVGLTAGGRGSGGEGPGGEGSSGACAILGDRDLCFEALVNLLDNALKFTPPGGAVRAGATRDGAAVRIYVEDTGPGIPPGERERVFGRFYRGETARRTAGNGLGLGRVAAIAALHGAQTRVGEAAGGGCRMELVFGSSETGEPVEAAVLQVAKAPAWINP